MRPLLTVQAIRRSEQQAIEAGTTESDLMLQAGTSIAELIHDDHLGDRDHALVLAGPGKNGGDGIVIANRLRELGWTVRVWTHQRDGIASAPVSHDDAKKFEWLASNHEAAEFAAGCSVVIDAVFGAGGRADLPDDVVQMFEAIIQVRKQGGVSVWAVDVPSGIDADTGEAAAGALPADSTAMIGFPKIGAFRFPAATLTGEIRYVDIGLEKPADLSDVPNMLTEQNARDALPVRRAGLHKRSAGTVTVVGGAPNYYGAPRLTAEAALRSGAGLVSVAAPSSIIVPMASAVPELTYIPLPVGEHATASDRMAAILKEKLPEADALVIGPGLGTEAPVPEFLAQLLGFSLSDRRSIGFGSQSSDTTLEPFAGNAVLDADALNWLAGQDSWWETLAGASLVLTPHPGELSRLLDIDREAVEADPWKHASDAATRFGQVVVLKYGHAVVATPDGELRIAPQAPPSLATAGTGDVLSGIIGGLLGQGLSPVDAASVGIILGLCSARLAEWDTGTVGLIASDIIDHLPDAYAALKRANSVVS